MHAAKHDVFRRLLIGRATGKLKAVAREIGKLNHAILLVVMAEDHQLFPQRLLGRRDAQCSSGSESWL